MSFFKIPSVLILIGLFIILTSGCEEDTSNDTNIPTAHFEPITGVRVGVEYVVPLYLEYENRYHPSNSDEPLPTISFKTLDLPEWLQMTQERAWGAEYLLKGRAGLEDIGVVNITIEVTNGIEENLYNFDINVIENSLESVFVPVESGEYLLRHYDANNRVVEDVEIIDYDYEIMQYEVTNQEYADYLNEALLWGKVHLDTTNEYGFNPRYGVVGFHPGDEYMDAFDDKMLYPFNDNGVILFSYGIFSVSAGMELYPATDMTWYGAMTYAKHFGLKIPLYQEWQKAARGMVGDDFALNIHPDLPLRYYTNYKDSGDPWDNGPSPVGYFNGQGGTRDAPSPYGTYDMTGNVSEWNLSYSSYNYDTRSNNQSVAGGNFMQPLLPYQKDTDAAELYTWSPGWIKGATASERIGFRCIRK